MQLIVILLATVSILTILSGITVFFGSSREDRSRSAWFFIATIFAAIWMTSISIFLIAPKEWSDAMSWHVNWTYISAIFIDVALLGYICWRDKYGKIITSFFLLFGAILTAFFVRNPSLLYTDIILSNAGNSITINIGPFFFTYIAFFFALVPTVVGALLKKVITPTPAQKRGASLTLLVGFAISGTCSIIFDLILPLWRWDLSWVGPLTVSTTIIALYCAVLRYRSLNLSSIWLKALSYIVIIASLAVVYMVIFSIIFAAMFRGSTPSTEVIVLNFVMIVIFLLLMPAINEVTSSIRSIIMEQNKDSKKIKGEKKEKAHDGSK